MESLIPTEEDTEVCAIENSVHKGTEINVLVTKEVPIKALTKDVETEAISIHVAPEVNMSACVGVGEQQAEVQPMLDENVKVLVRRRQLDRLIQDRGV